MNSFYTFLQKIRERPRLYLRNKSLAQLDAFLCGYAFGVVAARWEKATGLDFFENFDLQCSYSEPSSFSDWCDLTRGFDEFVHSFYNYGISTLSGGCIIIRESSSEEEAFDQYFELLDEFLKQNQDIP